MLFEFTICFVIISLQYCFDESGELTLGSCFPEGMDPELAQSLLRNKHKAKLAAGQNKAKRLQKKRTHCFSKFSFEKNCLES
jgi:hypothetical protein